MNVLSMLQLKKTVVTIDANSSVRQAIEKCRHHSYTALPVLDEEGKYVGTVSEGDFLEAVLHAKECDIHNLEELSVSSIIRQDFNPCTTVDVDIVTLLEMVTNQNFVPIVDDRHVFMGIITRRSVISNLMSEHNNPSQSQTTPQYIQTLYL